MSDSRKLERDELGRHIARLEVEIIQFAQQIPRFEGVNILLRFEDAYDNLMGAVLQQLKETDDDKNQYRASSFDYPVKSMSIVNDALQIMLVHGKQTSRRLIEKLPAIVFWIGYCKHDEDPVDEAMNNGFIKKGDFYDSFEIPSMAVGDAKFRVILKLISPNLETKQYTIDFVWSLVRLIEKKRVLQTVLYSGGQAFLDKYGDISRIDLSAQLRAEIASHRSFENVHRTFASMSKPFDWASDFRERGNQALKSIPKGLNSEENIKALAEETEELEAAYKSFPGFRQLFSKMAGYTFDEFLAFTTTLEKLAREAALAIGHPVYDGFLGDLRAQCETEGLEASTTTKLIDSFTWRPNSKPPAFPIYMINGRCVFSFRQVLLAKINRPTGIYERYLDGEIKGRKFEENCRRLLRENGLHVFPDRTPVHGFLPEDVSMKLWGSEKAKSDIDVLALYGKKLLVIECKSMKRSPKKKMAKSHEANILKNASVEAYYKATWLEERIRKQDLTNKMLLRFLKDAELALMIPLTVTNQEVRVPGAEDSAATISLGDLLFLSQDLESRAVQLTESRAALMLAPSPASQISTSIVQITSTQHG